MNKNIFSTEDLEKERKGEWISENIFIDGQIYERQRLRKEVEEIIDSMESKPQKSVEDTGFYVDSPVIMDYVKELKSRLGFGQEKRE